MADAGDRGCWVRKLAYEFWRCFPYAVRADRTLGCCPPTSPVQEIFPVSAKDSEFPYLRSGAVSCASAIAQLAKQL